MIDSAIRARATAIETFAALLRDLRASAGNPSFREMSGRSRAISHTTLHEAAQGNRLPSWSTTVEFVKACGSNPDDYRARWDAANRAVRAAGQDEPSEIAVEPPAPQSAPAEPSDPVAPSALAELPRRRRLRAVVGVGAVLVVGAVAATVVATSGDGTPASGGDGRGTTAKDCPLHSPNPPAAPPATKGDSGVFIGDITLPDCTHVGTGQSVKKVWRLKNVGTVPWRGYSLHRLDDPLQRGQCQTTPDVPIADTMPGRFVDITTEVIAPRAPGFCYVRFQVRDSRDRIAFPGGRPLNFQLVIE